MLELPPYVFRGTTKNWPGNPSAIEGPFTYTSVNPIKALWFALECYKKNPDAAVIYLARRENLIDLDIHSNNYLSKVEEEIKFTITPEKFYTRCDGHIHCRDFQFVANSSGYSVYNIVRIDNLTRLCYETGKLSKKEIERLVQAIRPFLKK
ncbi:hypothetical protein [Dinghuibacter silviterrae]|uniref:hypothetical protein n=1 Tax=Dinghuibacter silviterrae TaxID=1539049 RepID=UPI00106419B2|nr:hypothetical protein [Dinghuibacter silviterrae]